MRLRPAAGQRLVLKAVRIADRSADPANATSAETTLRSVEEGARTIVLQIHVLHASTSGEIDAAFAALARDRPDALFISPDGFFFSRTVQFATLAAQRPFQVGNLSQSAG